MEHPEQSQAHSEPSSAVGTSAALEEQNARSTRKKWLWGCGGCLIAVILVVTVLGFLSVNVFNNLQENSEKATQRIFGSNPPAGYLVIGARLPKETGVRNLVVLLNRNNQRQMLFAFDTTQLTEQQMAQLRQGKPSEEALKNLMQGMMEGAPASNGSVQVEKLTIDSVMMAKLANGRGEYPIVSAKVEDDKTFMPTVTALLPHAGNRLVGLVGLDLATKSPEASADFSSSYQTLQGTIQGIITETDLDETAVLK